MEWMEFEIKTKIEQEIRTEGWRKQKQRGQKSSLKINGLRRIGLLKVAQ